MSTFIFAHLSARLSYFPSYTEERINSKGTAAGEIDARRCRDLFCPSRGGKLSASAVFPDVHSITLIKGNAIIRQTHKIRLQGTGRRRREGGREQAMVNILPPVELSISRAYM